MTDFIANDDGRWENQDDPWRVADNTGPAAALTQRTTATERWGRSVVIIAALSALSWAVVIGIVIVALAVL